MTPPILMAFDFDLDSGNLTLTFNEVVNRSMAVFSSVVLRNSPNATATMFPLTGSTGDAGLSTRFVINVGEENLNNIKANTELVTSASDTYLTLMADFIPDTSGNVYSDSTTVFFRESVYS